MKISLVTSVFNRVSTIGCTMDSVADQTFLPYEYIIQDGGSSDGTIEVVMDRAVSYCKVVSEPDGGIYHGINKGIKRASGDVIGLLHSDDFLARPSVLASVADAFARFDVDGVFGDLQYVAAADVGHVVRHWRAGEYKFEKLRFGWMPPHPTLYLRREVFERYGLYDTKFSISADYDAMLRYMFDDKLRFAYIPDVLVKMRVGGESNRSIERLIRKSREDLWAIRRNGIGGIFTLIAKNIRKIDQYFVGGH